MWIVPSLRLFALTAVAFTTLQAADAVQQSVELTAIRDLLATDLASAVNGLPGSIGSVPAALRQALIDIVAAKQLAVIAAQIPPADDLIDAMNDFVADRRLSDPVDHIVDLTTLGLSEANGLVEQAVLENNSLTGVRASVLAQIDTVRSTATISIAEIDSLLAQYQSIISQISASYTSQLGANALGLVGDALVRADEAAGAVRDTAVQRAQVAFFDAAASLYAIASSGLGNGLVSPVGLNTLTAIPALQAQAATVRDDGMSALTAALTYALGALPKTAEIDAIVVGEIVDIEQLYQIIFDNGTRLVDIQNPAAAQYESTTSGPILATTAAGFGVFQTALQVALDRGRSELQTITAQSLQALTATGLTQYLQTAAPVGQKELVAAVVARARDGMTDAAKEWMSDNSIGYGTPVANSLDAYINASAEVILASIHTRYDGRVNVEAIDFTVSTLNNARATLLGQVVVLRNRLLELYDGMVESGIANATHPHPEIDATYAHIRSLTDELLSKAYNQGDQYLSSLQVNGGGFKRDPIPVTVIDAQAYDGLSFTENNVAMINDGLSILDNDVYRIQGALTGLTGVSTGDAALDAVAGANDQAFTEMMAVNNAFIEASSGILALALGLFSSQTCRGSDL